MTCCQLQLMIWIIPITHNLPLQKYNKNRNDKIWALVSTINVQNEPTNKMMMTKLQRLDEERYG